MSKFRLGLAAFCGFINPFGSVFESVTDYVLEVLNKYLSRPDIADHIVEAREFTLKILESLTKYAWMCPSKWYPAYCETISVVTEVVNVFEDNKVEIKEIEGCIDAFKHVYEAWKAE